MALSGGTSLRGLGRRLAMTYRYLGLLTLLWRVVSFPLRFTPLEVARGAIGREVYEQGIGAHAVSYIEYPLAGQFSALEVTVGIDGYTEGRGTVEFRIYADGKEVASSGALNGFSKPKTLTVDELQGVQRLILSVTDGNDGTKNDLANWVDGRLILPAK